MTTRRDRTGVGLVGLGNMGAALLERLLAAGHPVIAFDIRSDARASAAAAGATAVGTIEELAELIDIVILSLPTPAVSAAIVTELARSAAPGSIVIETSTVTGEHARLAAAELHAAGMGYMDAAILSGVGEVRSGSSAFLLGGDPSVIEVARPMLQGICERLFVLGEVGAGMAAKVINNAVAHAVMVVLAEANAMALATGIPTEMLCSLLDQDDAGLRRPLHARLAGRYVRQEYEGGMSVEAARKDSALALEVARSHGIPLFTINAADTVYELALARGLGRLDYASILTLWDQWSATEDRQ
jgi:3-hydroxyisobutyrate dehydrogenase-like beta-hydroxyacid dehydrogenase